MLLATLLCGVLTSANARSFEPEELALASAVDQERATRTVEELVALGPRMGGTAAGEASAVLLAERFAACGLAVEVHEDPRDWCHAEPRWGLTVIAEDGDGWELASAWPLGFSPAASGTAPLAARPVGGSAFLASRVPAFLLDPPDELRDLPALCLVDGETTLGGEYPRLRALATKAPRPAFGLSRAEGRRLRQLLRAGADVAIRYELEALIAEAAPRTVVATLPGRRDEGYFLVCAHGDSDAGGPGANDNASGVAIVLEIAAAWSDAVQNGAARPPARAVRFAIWGKEIHSTRALLARAEESGEQILGVLNFDQCGYGEAGDRLHIEPDELPANRAFVEALLGVLGDGREREGFPRRWVTNKSLGGTDSYVFSSAELFRARGLPALTLYASAWGRPRTVARTPGQPGESWNDGDEVAIDFDRHYHSAGDTSANTTARQPWHLGWHARVGLLGTRRYLESLDD